MTLSEHGVALTGQNVRVRTTAAALLIAVLVGACGADDGGCGGRVDSEREPVGSTAAVSLVPHEVEFDDGETAMEYEWLDLFGGHWSTTETPTGDAPVEGTATRTGEGVSVVLRDGTPILFSGVACG